MLEKGWIEPAKDAVYAAPVLIIKKPGTYEDGSSKGYRFCTDFRGLNSVVKPLKHHIPDIYKMWDHLKEAKFISVCDMKHGYFNFAINVRSGANLVLGFLCYWPFELHLPGIHLPGIHLPKFYEELTIL